MLAWQIATAPLFLILAAGFQLLCFWQVSVEINHLARLCAEFLNLAALHTLHCWLVAVSGKDPMIQASRRSTESLERVLQYTYM